MANVSSIKLPNGTTYNIKDSISGYTTNTGTITQVKTTAGAHTTINVSSGVATFNVPTKTSDLTNDSGFITSSGYECTETEVVFFNGSITTTDQGGASVGMFTLSQPISGNTLTVTMNDTEYELPKEDLNGQAYYGEISGGVPVFTNYPCLVFSQENSGFFYTENAGTYSVKIKGFVETTTITPCFQKAVKSSINILEHLLDGQASGSLRSSTSVSEDGVYYIGEGAVALGVGTKASGMYSFAEGYNTKANATCSHAEGYNTTASESYSHVEGAATTANGFYSHAEGNTTTANGDYSHAEGYYTSASGSAAHAEGTQTTTSGSAAHAEGTQTTASSAHSHAEGYYTTASGIYSHAEGNHTTANHRSQHTFGEYNILDPSSAAATSRGNYIEIVGNGTSTSARSNARTLDWSGNEVIAGKLTLGAGPTANMDAATKQYVDNSIPQAYSSTNTGGYLTMATLPIYDGTVV